MLGTAWSKPADSLLDDAQFIQPSQDEKLIGKQSDWEPREFVNGLPVFFGKKFDPKGVYVRRFVPELNDVPDKFVHKPWDAPSPPKHYPAPIVDLAAGRARAAADAAGRGAHHGQYRGAA